MTLKYNISKVPELTSGNVLGSKEQRYPSQTFPEMRCRHDLKQTTVQWATFLYLSQTVKVYDRLAVAACASYRVFHFILSP
jgi:hypothetical protein